MGLITLLVGCSLGDNAATATVTSQPELYPDGSKIAFESNRDGNEEIYVMNADGSNQTRVTNNDAADRHPSWSHDGSNESTTHFREG